jgi:hypothetical protein
LEWVEFENGFCSAWRLLDSTRRGGEFDLDEELEERVSREEVGEGRELSEGEVGPPR